MSERDVLTDDGVWLRTRIDGPPEAPALLLCNSLGTDLTLWDDQVAAWAASRRVVRFDQRGHGASEAPPAPYEVSRLGRDALTVLDAHEIEVADVCGISLGGLVALWLAAAAPERVRRLVLADTATRIGTEEAWQTRAEMVRHDGMDAVVDMVLARFFSRTFLQTASPVVERVARILRQTAVEGYIGSCEALASADLRELAARVRATTLVIVGGVDEATAPAEARELSQLLPDARLVEIEAVGHLANLEAPDIFAEHVADFVSGGEIP